MILSIVFAITIASSAPGEEGALFDFDSSLEEFCAESQNEDGSWSCAQEPEPEPVDLGQGGWPWRIAGYLKLAACGFGVPATSHYRTTRSDWMPNGPDNSAARTAIFGGIAMASNVFSDRVRRGGRNDAAWATRLTTLGACVWDSIHNARNGWHRQ